MGDPPVGRHWLLGVLDRTGRLPPDTPVLAATTPLAEAWVAAAEAAGVDDAMLAILVGAHYRLKPADLTKAEPRAQRLVPESFARKHLLLPLRETDRELVVATADPSDFEAEQGIGFASGRTPVFEIAPPTALQAAVDLAYSPDRALDSLLEKLPHQEDELVRLVEGGEPDHLTEDDVESAPVVKLTSLIFRDAIRQRASDIHIEPGRDGGRVRFRVDGVMRQYMQLPMPALYRILSRIKIMGQLDIADRLRPQDGRARIGLGNFEYDLRISTVPTREAEKAEIRLLNPQGMSGLAEVGFSEEIMKRFREVLGSRDGIVVVTGPTGSGKTTSLYGALQEVATEDVNIMTVEDPIEYELPGVTQIQVEPKRGVTFASALRAILRQDPDVILVGEIRDLETAEVAVQASMTGHLVLATLHTNDAVGVIQRLGDLGLDTPSIAGTLRAVLAQRLVRRLCEDCSVPAPDGLPKGEAELALRYGIRPTRIRVGCDVCGGTGYRGRLPIAELLVADEGVRAAIGRGGSHAEIRDAAVAGGMRLLDELALEPVRAGLTTLEEIAREMGEPEQAVAPDQPHVLLVDDDAVNRTLAKTLLVKNGYRVTEAVDGEDAVARLSSNGNYSLMVLDLDMPKMGGREVLQHVRSTMSTAGLPVVVLTGTNDKDAEIELMDAGADDYIRKPLDPPRFVTRLKAALRRAAG